METMLGTTVEEYEENVRKIAEQVVQVGLVAEGIVEQERMDVDAAYDRVAQQMMEEDGWDTVEEMEQEMGGRSAVEQEVIYRIAAEYMMEQGTAVSES